MFKHHLRCFCKAAVLFIELLKNASVLCQKLIIDVFL
jgi:hypothetical protein